jgi:DNA replication and repair protein RecF
MLDSLGARLSKSFATIKTEYYKTLRHKNSLLKQEEVDTELLDSWNINHAKLGNSLAKHRRGLFEKLLLDTGRAYAKISGGEKLEGHYLSMLEGEDFYTELTKKKEEEVRAKRALVGPHRDDLLFVINGNDARRFASQGQQRTLALALKIAEIEILKRVSTKDPLLLLDDVMSELDETRRSYFMELVAKSAQTVLTTTNLGYFDEEFLGRATVVELS